MLSYPSSRSSASAKIDRRHGRHRLDRRTEASPKTPILLCHVKGEFDR
jgi:hypothetical protein